MGVFNFEYSDIVMKTGKVLLIGIVLAVVFLFSPPDHESIIPAAVENAVKNNAANSTSKNATPNK